MQIKAYIDSASIDNKTLVSLLKASLPYATSLDTPIHVTGKELSSSMRISIRTVRSHIKDCVRELTNEVSLSSIKGRNGYYSIQFNEPYIKLYEDYTVGSLDSVKEVKVSQSTTSIPVKRKHNATGNPVGRPKANDISQPPSQLQLMIDKLSGSCKPMDKIKLGSITIASIGQFKVWRPEEIYMPNMKRESTLALTTQKKVEKERNARLNKEIKLNGLHWKHFQESSDPEGNLEAYLLMCAYSVYKNIIEFKIDVKELDYNIAMADSDTVDITKVNTSKLFNYHSFIQPESKIFGTSWMGSFKRFAEVMKGMNIAPLTGLSYLFSRKDFYLSLPDSHKINIESPNQLYSETALGIIEQSMEYSINTEGTPLIYNKDNNIVINTIEAMLNNIYRDGLAGVKKGLELANVNVIDNIVEWVEATAESYPDNCQMPYVMNRNKKLAVWFKNTLQTIDNNDKVKDKELAKTYLANIVKVQQVGLSKGFPTLGAMAVPEIRQSMLQAKKDVHSELDEVAQGSLEQAKYYFSELHYIGDMKGSLQLEEPIYGSLKTNGQVARSKDKTHDTDCLYSTASLFEYTQTIGMDLLFIIGQLLDEALDIYPVGMTLASIGIPTEETLAGGLLNLEYIVEHTYAEPVKTLGQEAKQLRNVEITALSEQNNTAYKALSPEVTAREQANENLINSMKEKFKYILSE